MTSALLHRAINLEPKSGHRLVVFKSGRVSLSCDQLSGENSPVFHREKLQPVGGGSVWLFASHAARPGREPVCRTPHNRPRPSSTTRWGRTAARQPSSGWTPLGTDSRRSTRYALTLLANRGHGKSAHKPGLGATSRFFRSSSRYPGWAERASAHRAFSGSWADTAGHPARVPRPL
jgi:hypothetical protein